MPLLGLVLAGGESRRMGVDKGTIRYHGVPQRLHAAGLLARHTESVFVSVRPDQLPTLEPALAPMLDPAPGLGPMAGLLAAIGHRPDAAWLVVACDLPFLDEATLAALVAGRKEGYDAVAYAGTDEPVLGQPTPTTAWHLVTTGGFEFVRPDRHDEDQRPRFEPNSVLGVVPA